MNGARWTRLRDEVDEARRAATGDWANRLRVQVRRAVEKNVCDRMAPHHIRERDHVVEIAPRQGGATISTRREQVPALALSNLPRLTDAKLAFRVTLGNRGKSIEQYTLTAIGTEKASGHPWYARVDLDPEQRGAGPCSHAMLHAHLGMPGDEDEEQAARVPLPWLDPDEALAWLLATLDPRLEPT